MVVAVWADGVVETVEAVGATCRYAHQACVYMRVWLLAVQTCPTTVTNRLSLSPLPPPSPLPPSLSPPTEWEVAYSLHLVTLSLTPPTHPLTHPGGTSLPPSLTPAVHGPPVRLAVLDVAVLLAHRLRHHSKAVRLDLVGFGIRGEGDEEGGGSGDAVRLGRGVG